ncbi:MAG: hypothetical protein R2880_16910 [Deinococcales bacterium]
MASPHSISGTFLAQHHLSGLSIHYMPKGKRRAVQLGQFMQQLLNLAENELQLELYVLDKKDWTKLSSKPYFLSLYQVPKAGKKAKILVPLEYPDYQLKRCDALILAGARHHKPPPLSLSSYFDLILGQRTSQALLHHWIQQSLVKNSLNTAWRYLFASHLFELLLSKLEMMEMLQHYQAWSACLSISYLEDPLEALQKSDKQDVLKQLSREAMLQKLATGFAATLPSRSSEKGFELADFKASIKQGTLSALKL